MDAKTLKSFKKELERTRVELLAGQSANNEDLHVDRNEQFDDIDAAAADTDQSLQMRLRSRGALYLKKVNSALLKIENGTFGECEDCGGEIEVRRLKARPTADLCIDCKEEQEKLELSTIQGRRSKSLGQGWRPKG
jgi:DnaK suppressor protein